MRRNVAYGTFTANIHQIIQKPLENGHFTVNMHQITKEISSTYGMLTNLLHICIK